MDELKQKILEESFRKVRHYCSALESVFEEIEYNLKDNHPAMNKYYCAKDHLAKMRRYSEHASFFVK